jgi:hypothetical protein
MMLRGRWYWVDEHGHADDPVEDDSCALPPAPRPCPVCVLRIGGNPCATCVREREPEACDHLCQHGGNRAHTGECCYRGPTYGEACEYDE